MSWGWNTLRLISWTGNSEGKRRSNSILGRCTINWGVYIAVLRAASDKHNCYLLLLCQTSILVFIKKFSLFYTSYLRVSEILWHKSKLCLHQYCCPRSYYSSTVLNGIYYQQHFINANLTLDSFFTNISWLCVWNCPEAYKDRLLSTIMSKTPPRNVSFLSIQLEKPYLCSALMFSSD